MSLTYKKLFHLLLDRNIKKGELQEKAGITASIMARLAKDETVKSDTLGKICDALECQPGDIMENVPMSNIASATEHEKHYKPLHEVDIELNNKHTETTPVLDVSTFETLEQKLERLHREHTTQKSIRSEE